MALGSALVDRARIHTRSPAYKVRGRTVMAPITGEWFRCRLEQRNQPQTSNRPSGQPRVTKQPSLMFGRVDLAGEEVKLDSTHTLEVIASDSALGSQFFQVEGDPDPIRKKRRIIGWEARLKRVDEHEFDPSGVEAAQVG